VLRKAVVATGELCCSCLWWYFERLLLLLPREREREREKERKRKRENTGVWVGKNISEYTFSENDQKPLTNRKEIIILKSKKRGKIRKIV